MQHHKQNSKHLEANESRQSSDKVYTCPMLPQIQKDHARYSGWIFLVGAWREIQGRMLGTVIVSGNAVLLRCNSL